MVTFGGLVDQCAPAFVNVAKRRAVVVLNPFDDLFLCAITIRLIGFQQLQGLFVHEWKLRADQATRHPQVNCIRWQLKRVWTGYGSQYSPWCGFCSFRVPSG